MSFAQAIPLSPQTAAPARSVSGRRYSTASATEQLKQPLGHSAPMRVAADGPANNSLSSVIGTSVAMTSPSRAGTVRNDGSLTAGLASESAALTPSFGQPSRVVAALDLVIVQLGRLRDGGAGDGTKSPTEATLRDVAATLTCLPPNTTMPSLEVDPEDGYVTLIWQKPEHLFALTFAGAGAVIGTAAGGIHYRPWRISISDEIGIACKLEGDGALGAFAQ
jgi:hypothetical protein